MLEKLQFMTIMLVNDMKAKRDEVVEEEDAPKMTLVAITEV